MQISLSLNTFVTRIAKLDMHLLRAFFKTIHDDLVATSSEETIDYVIRHRSAVDRVH